MLAGCSEPEPVLAPGYGGGAVVLPAGRVVPAAVVLAAAVLVLVSVEPEPPEGWLGICTA